MKKSYRQITEEVLSDERPIIVDTNIAHSWFIISSVQLAYRHPSLSRDMKQRMRIALKPFEDAIISQHPEAKKVLADGWNHR